MTFWLIIILVTVLDQVSKFIVQTTPAFQNIEVIPNFFYITYLKNTGAAWSMFSGMTGGLTLISALAIGIMLWYVYAKKPKGMLKTSLALMIAGAAGNFIDRLALSYVRDFLNFYIFGYDFPVFNIADCALTIGVILLIIASLVSDREEKHG